MLIDGRELAKQEYYQISMQIGHMGVVGRMAIIATSTSPATKQYLDLKLRRAAETNQTAVVHQLPETATTTACIELIETLAAPASQYDGIVLQLPLAESIDTEQAIKAIPYSHDVDGLRSVEVGSRYASPVAVAITRMLHQCIPDHADWTALSTVIVGDGRLVGRPVKAWLERNYGLLPILLTKSTPEDDYWAAIAAADVIITGVGQAHFLKPKHIKPGVILLDAGASESSGTIVGDVDPACNEKASFMSPVPGGIGPLAVATLLRNLVNAAEQSAYDQYLAERSKLS